MNRSPGFLSRSHTEEDAINLKSDAIYLACRRSVEWPTLGASSPLLSSCVEHSARSPSRFMYVVCTRCDVTSPDLKNAQSEFYGKEFALFSDGDQPHSLKAVLEARPDR